MLLARLLRQRGSSALRHPHAAAGARAQLPSLCLYSFL